MGAYAKLLAFAGIFSAGCATARVPVKAPAPLSVYRYPAWFVDGAVAAHAAVGYAPRYETRALSESLSVADGAERLRAYRRVRVRDEQAFVASAGSALEHVAEVVRLEPMHDAIPARALAYAERGTMALALVGPERGPVVRAGEVSLSVRAPSWVRNPPRGNAGTVVVGIARATYREELGWQEAEENGLRQLAAVAASELRGLQRSTPGVQESVVSSRAEAVLESVVVLARWRDGSNCFVLMRGLAMPIGMKP